MGAREVAAFVAAASFATPASAQTTPSSDILARASAYVRQFVGAFSSVVAEEQYVQKQRAVPRVIGSGFASRTVEAVPPRDVSLSSDFLLVRTDDASDYLAFRDVFLVDGRPVRDREERLMRLLSSPSREALDQARRLADEGARYDLAGKYRSVNNPLIALAMLQDRYRARFEWTVRNADKAAGPDVWTVQFKEVARPALLRSLNGDAPSSGRLWIEAATGRIVKTELAAGLSRVTTTFQFDERFQIDVPTAMSDSFDLGDMSVTGVATYGRFRKFGVQTDERLKQ